MKKTRPLFVVLLICLTLCGCAATPRASSSIDPLEPMNRNVDSFNHTVDSYVLKPIAQGYDAAIPNLIKRGISNFFQNLSDLRSAVNSLLQLKGQKFGDDMSRVMVNTFLGFGGLIDHATLLGIERGAEDFGQTLGYWGLGEGPYLVVPFLGPSSIRDLTGTIGDGYLTDLMGYVSPVDVRNSLYGLRLVERRAALLPAESLLNQAALDLYTFTRAAYLQQRKSQVLDGKRLKDADDE